MRLTKLSSVAVAARCVGTARRSTRRRSRAMSTGIVVERDGDDDVDIDFNITDVRRRRTRAKDAKGRAKERARDDGAKDASASERSAPSWLHLGFLCLFILPGVFAALDYVFKFTPERSKSYAHVSDEAKMYKMKIRALYEDYNPSKVAEIPKLMDKYRGRERALYRAIEKKCASSIDSNGVFRVSSHRRFAFPLTLCSVFSLRR